MGAHAENYLQPARFTGTAVGCQPPLPLEFLSTIDAPGVGTDKLNRVCKTVHQNDRSYLGFNFFDEDDQMLFEALARGEFNISGWQNKTLRPHLRDKSSGQVSRLLKRLRLHGLARKVGRTYKYYLTAFGKQVIAAGLSLKHLFLISQLAACHCSTT